MTKAQKAAAAVNLINNFPPDPPNNCELYKFPTGSVRGTSQGKEPSRHGFDVEAGINTMNRVLDFGQKKYGRNNWRKGQTYMRVIESMQHHINKFANGEDRDEESGESHMGHIMCNAAFLEHFVVFKDHLAYSEAELDDRDAFLYEPPGSE